MMHAASGLRLRSPWILPDEVLYSDLAKSIAAGHLPSVRGTSGLGWGVVYPALIAPAWAAFDNASDAYHAALVINAFVMSLAAVPAFLLARMFVGRLESVVVAAMTLLVPSMAYTGVLMTENACYPAFLLAVLLIARSVRSPSLLNQALALLGLGVVALTRIQGVALVVAYLGAVVVYAWTGPRSHRGPYLRRFVPTAVVSVIASFAPTASSAARGAGPTGWLGSRSETFDALQPGEVPKWFAFLVADLVLYVAVIPVAATVIVLGRALTRSRSSEPARLFAAVTLPTLLAVLGSVSFVNASIDVDGTENLDERYVFYVVPLAFIGLALWTRGEPPRSSRWSWAVVGVSALLVVGLPIGRLAYNAEFQTLALLPWLTLSLSRLALAVVVAAFAIACAAVWMTWGHNRPARLWLTVGVWMAFLAMVAMGRGADRASSFSHRYVGSPASWVDEAVPSDAKVTVLWDQRLAQGPWDRSYQALMVTEVFNNSVGDVYRLGGPTVYEGVLPTLPARAASTDVVAGQTGRPVVADYVLAPCRTPVRGTVIASAGALRLLEVGGSIDLTGQPGCAALQP
jgi:hypothetical protein